MTTSRERMARKRARDREAGRCVCCGADSRKPGKFQCADCINAAAERLRRRRANTKRYKESLKEQSGG